MFNYKDKKANLAALNGYMLNKTLAMFEYSGLPETIPQKELEKLLQKQGYAFITEVGGKLYALSGGLGGVQDAYGNPTEIVISNAGLNFNATLNLEKDGVLIYNDDLGMGLMPLFNRYNSMIVENDINIIVHGYNTRLSTLLSASDDTTRASAQRVIDKIVEGEISVAGENAIFDGMKVHNSGANNAQNVQAMIELTQYLKAVLHNEVGISGNVNLKRERLLGAEVEQNESGIFSLVFSMGKCRFNALEKINKKYGLNICIGFGSVWKEKDFSLIDGKVKEDAKEIDNPSGSAGTDSVSSGEANQGEETTQPQPPAPAPSPEDESAQGGDGNGNGSEAEPVAPAPEPEPKKGDNGEEAEAPAPEPEASPSPSEVETQLAEVEEMLKGEDLTEEDKAALLELKAELEGKLTND